MTMATNPVCTAPALVEVAPPAARCVGTPDVRLPVSQRSVDAHNAALNLTATGTLLRIGYDAEGWMADQYGRRFVAIDCEAGGRDPQAAALLSVTARAMHRTGLDQSVSMYVLPEPGRAFTDEALAVHGLSRKRLAARGALPAAVALASLVQVLPVLGGQAPVVAVGHCVAYDRDVLGSTAAAAGIQLPVAAWSDTYPSTKILREMSPVAGHQAARNTLETFVWVTTGVKPIRGVHTADGDVALLVDGLRALAARGACLAGPQSR